MPVPLHRYADMLWALDVELGGAARTFLFDTGVGVTSIDARLARELGLEPRGRLTGYRMEGHRVDLGICHDVALNLDGAHEVCAETLGVLDLRGLLPEGAPPVHGVIGLDLFADRTVAFDLAGRRLHLDAEPPPDASELTVRIERGVTGVSLVVFIAVRGQDATVWLQLDTGNTGAVVLAPHAAELLDVRAGPVRLDVIGDRTLETEVVIKDLIIDGNLGATFADDRTFTFDGRAGRLWRF